MNVSIIGSGLQCRRRAPIIIDSKEDNLISISGLNFEQTRSQAKIFKCEVDLHWKDTVKRKDVDAIIICTPPSLHSEIAIEAMRSGKHVLCEKPLSKTVLEATEMLKVSLETKKTLKCGFNHRHHPAILEAKKKLDEGWIGKPLFIRSIYGICGRPGYEKEWRANPNLASGGQFIEQGSHLIDLIRWFIGDIKEVSCMTSIHYFKNQTLEDNGFAIFRAKNGATASLHTSMTQWNNKFNFEIYGEDGYLIIEGLGGTYGEEKLIKGKRDFDAPFRDDITYFRAQDISWRLEWNEFVSAIKENREPLGSASDGLNVMKIAIAAYESEKKKSVIEII
jgi:predicted dehydrogenase